MINYIGFNKMVCTILKANKSKPASRHEQIRAVARVALKIIILLGLPSPLATALNETMK